MEESFLTPQQGQKVQLYLLYEDGQLTHIFTHSVQAEAFVRFLMVGGATHHMYIRTFETEPHNNFC